MPRSDRSSKSCHISTSCPTCRARRPTGAGAHWRSAPARAARCGRGRAIVRRSGDRRQRIGMYAATFVVAAAAMFAQAPPAQTPPAQPQPPDMPTPRFRTEADVVVVEATVLDRKGAIVGGLGLADFKVEIGGKPREIVSVDLVEYAPPSSEAETAAGDLEITTNDPKEVGRVILLVIDQASLASDARTVIESAQKWVR